MRRLSELQDVTLLAGATQLRCRVVAVDGRQAALRPVETPRVSRSELTGPASITFVHQGALVALKGRARWGDEPDDLRFAVRDGVELPQQRNASRLRIPLQLTVDGRAAETIDLSAAGLSLAGGGFGGPGAELVLVIDLPDHGPALRCRGRVVRERRDMTAVRFSDLDGDEAERLARFVFAVQRMLAGGELDALAG